METEPIKTEPIKIESITAEYVLKDYQPLEMLYGKYQAGTGAVDLRLSILVGHLDDTLADSDFDKLLQLSRRAGLPALLNYIEDMVIERDRRRAEQWGREGIDSVE